MGLEGIVMPAENLSRRGLLVAGVGVATVAGLAACAPLGGSTGATVAATKNPQGVEAIPLSKVPVGNGVGTKVNGKSILVSQPTAGQVHAFSAVCTHEGCILSAAGKIFSCPCHGSEFDSATGAVLKGPATQALPEVNVKLVGDQVTFPS